MNGFSTQRFFRPALAIAALCMALFSAVPGVRAGELVDRIVAVVNDDVITLFELNQALKPYEDRIRKMDYTADQERRMMFKVREDLLQKLIDNALAEQEVKKIGISVDEQDIDQAVERFKKDRFLTDEDLRRGLERQNMTYDDFRKELRERILQARLINKKVKSAIVITQKDVADYYEKNRDKYAGEISYHLSNIILKTPSFGSPEEKEAVLEKMREIHGILESGRPFSEVAMEYSQSSLARQGGDLGFFQLDELSPVIREVVKDTPVGSFTDVIDTDQGYQIFFVEEIRQEKGMSLEEATAKIQDELYNEILGEKYDTWMKELRTNSHIKVIN